MNLTHKWPWPPSDLTALAFWTRFICLCVHVRWYSNCSIRSVIISCNFFWFVDIIKFNVGVVLMISVWFFLLLLLLGFDCSSSSSSIGSLNIDIHALTVSFRLSFVFIICVVVVSSCCCCIWGYSLYLIHGFKVCLCNMNVILLLNTYEIEIYVYVKWCFCSWYIEAHEKYV